MGDARPEIRGIAASHTPPEDGYFYGYKKSKYRGTTDYWV
jgi:hypothetical protein